MNRSVLVLNQNFEPLNVCTWKRAVVLVFMGKAELVEKRDWRGMAQTQKQSHGLITERI